MSTAHGLLAQLGELLDTNGEKVPHYRGGYLSLGHINVLAQPRKTFEDITELADDIAEHGQLHPMVVARFTAPVCGQYLALLNRLWGSSFALRRLRGCKSSRGVVYYVLLAGERRYRALSLLWQRGCSTCRDTYGKNEPPGTCFARHFGRRRDTVEVRISTRMAPLPALFLQLSENTHVRVPPHEEAKAYTLLYRLLRQADTSFTVAAFARKVGRSPETIRHALRFSGLPLDIQRTVEKGYLPYGMALELTRLAVAGVKRNVLEYWKLRAITERRTVEQFRELVTGYLAHLRNGDGDLFGPHTETELAAARRQHIKRTVAREMIRGVWSWILYFRKVQGLFRDHLLGYPESPFSLRSPVRVTKSLLEELERLIPHMERVLTNQLGPARARQVLADAKALTVALENVVPDDAGVPERG